MDRFLPHNRRSGKALLEAPWLANTTVTINDVANEAGVALGTVSNAFNHPEKVAPKRLSASTRSRQKTGIRAQPECPHARRWQKSVCSASCCPALSTASHCKSPTVPMPRPKSTDTACSSPTRTTTIFSRPLPVLLYGHPNGRHPRAAHERLRLEALHGDALGPHRLPRLPQ